MINALTRAAKLGTLLAVTIFATAAGAQAPSQAQRDAIKSQCRGDYMAHCSSVPPGGADVAAMPAEEHVEPVGGLRGCSQGRAAAGRAEGGDGSCSGAREGIRADRRQDGAGAGRDDDSEARRPDSGAESRRDSCAGAAAEQRADFRDPQRLPLGLSKGLRRRPDRRRAGTAMPGKEQGKALGRLWTGGRRGKRRHCRAGGKWRQPPRRRRPPQRRRRPPSIVLRPMRPREELLVVRSACGADVRSLCGTVVGGGGRIVQCLASNAASLSPACKDVLAQFAAQ